MINRDEVRRRNSNARAADCGKLQQASAWSPLAISMQCTIVLKLPALPRWEMFVSSGKNCGDASYLLGE